MAVVGIDIGNLNNIVAIARKGGVDVILNNESKRETPCAVGFGSKQRFIGTAASSQVSMNPKNTITQVKRFLGRKFDDPKVQEDLKTYPVGVERGPNGECLFRVRYLDKEKVFTPEQILGMILTDLKSIADKDEGTSLTDFVISCPVFFDEVQRRAVLAAAKIAGIDCIKLMPETTATALGYGLYQTDLTEKPVNVAFVDVGHSSFQCSIVEFKKGALEVLAHTWDQNLGGRDFDRVLMDHFAQEFKSKTGMDVKTNKRAMVRLQVACEKIKKVLSANPESPLNIECLMEETDMRSHMTSDKFTELAESVLSRVRSPLEEALKLSKKENNDISVVQLVGSASRTPAIVKTIEEVFGGGGKIMRTLNASECVGRGCALACAMFSPKFHVREFGVKDVCPYPITVHYTSAENPEEQLSKELFNNTDPIPCTKAMTFQRSESFKIGTYYSRSASMPSQEDLIGQYTVGPIETPENQKAKLKIHFCIDVHGFFGVGDAVIESEKEKEMDAEEEARATEENGGQKADTTDPKSNGDQDVEMDPEKQANVNSKPKTKTINKIPVTVTKNFSLERHEDDLKEYINQEKGMVMLDKECHDTLEKKNALEEYVYSMRSKLSDQLSEYVTEKDAKIFSSALNEMEDWLYGDGEDQKMGVYEEKLKELKQSGDVYEMRYNETVNREQKANGLEDRIKWCRNFVANKRSEFSHISEAQWIQLESECDKAEKSYNEKKKDQESLSKTDDPILTCAFIDKKVNVLDNIVRGIMNTPKPQPKKDPKPEKEGGQKEDTKPGDSSKATTDNGKDQDAEMKDANETNDEMSQP